MILRAVSTIWKNDGQIFTIILSIEVVVLAFIVGMLVNQIDDTQCYATEFKGPVKPWVPLPGRRPLSVLPDAYPYDCCYDGDGGFHCMSSRLFNGEINCHEAHEISY